MIYYRIDQHKNANSVQREDLGDTTFQAYLSAGHNIVSEDFLAALVKYVLANAEGITPESPDLLAIAQGMAAELDYTFEDLTNDSNP